MPISRYEIRNEYSLADPELYRAADKDDPEALLEGVAMAGLVGVLRQLGDLAEFAADIFHNLHEEVMATAARGHGLMVRVQQLETEIPAIERAFLSQTDHSSFFCRAGVDWHPNVRLDHNLITQGDLPRFIMDSYEECRAPPRLFLLDKFDVAGAGACLKRYTDPSFFKVETSEIISADVQREKKIRKMKKKGPRLKNGETPEVLQTTHTKLHQLFLEERVENGVGKPSFRAKLKRRLNGFPFDSKTGKSYMEKLLKSPSPDHKVLHEVTMNSPPLMTPKNDHKESGFEIFEVRQVSPDRESWGRKRSPPSPDGEENMLNPSPYESNKPPIDDKLWEEPNSCSSVATKDVTSTLDNVTGAKVVAVDAEGDGEESLTGYQSDDIASEIDNFVDAPSNIESEMDRDSELRVKSDISSSHTKNESLMTDAYEEHRHTRSSDSSSPGESMISDDGNNSSTKERFSFSSASPSTSVAHPQGEKSSAKGFQYNDFPPNEMVDASSYHKTADEDFEVDHHSTRVVSDDTCSETDAITNHRSELAQLTSSLCSNGSITDLVHSDSEEVVIKRMLKAPESDEVVTTMDDEEKKANLVSDPPRSPILCGSESQSEDDSPGSSAGDHLVEEPNIESLPCPSTVPDIYCHTADSLGKTSLDSLHEDESDEKDRDFVNDVGSTSNILHDLSTNDTPEIISSENLILGKSEDEFPEVRENSPSDYPVTAHDGVTIDSAVSKEDDIIGVLHDEDSKGAPDSPNHFPCIMETSLEKKLEETSLANAQNVNVEEDHVNSSTKNQISSDNLKVVLPADSPDRTTEGLDAHVGVIIPEEETAADETLALETPVPREVAMSQDIGITHHVFPNNSEALESSLHTSGDLHEPAGTTDAVDLSSSGEEVTEISSSADLESVNEVHVLLDKSDPEADKSITSAVPAVSDNWNLNKLVEEHNNCFEDSGVDELENDKNHPSECHGESDIVERVSPTEASASGFETVFSNAVNNDHPKSEVSSTVPNSHLQLEVDCGIEFVHAGTVDSPVEQCGLDREQELLNRSDLQNHSPDAHSLPVDCDTEESIAQDKTGLPLSQLDQESLHPGEISSEFSFSLPINRQQMHHHDDWKQENDPPSLKELPRPSNQEIDVPGCPKDPLSSIFPPNNPFSETNQINLSDLPPLPPLPPVEWMMGKLHHASPSTEGETMRHKELSPQLISPQTVPSDIVSSPPPTSSTDVVGSSTLTAFTNDITSSLEEVKHSPIEISPETGSKEENIKNSWSSLGANTLHENKQQEIVKTISGSVATPPAEDDGVENGSRTLKLPRPRNPLIDDVAVLDKSKLRKVTERIRPEIQKVDERDSLLEQIRTKSFNLKPAVASRPSIRGPNTNLKVAAILEKANAIRQAFAGSDEDDGDSWSDS